MSGPFRSSIYSYSRLSLAHNPALNETHRSENPMHLRLPLVATYKPKYQISFPRWKKHSVVEASVASGEHEILAFNFGKSHRGWKQRSLTNYK